MTIRVISLDFDGCIFHIPYLDTPNHMNFPNTIVVDANRAFLDKLIKENRAYSNVFTFIGSNRQSYQSDRHNMNHERPSCFPAILQLNAALGAQFNPLLLSDIYENLPTGESFRRATDSDYRGGHAHWIFDETKATILYAQMQEIANAHPNEPIEFDYFDDRLDYNFKANRIGILQSLQIFYEKNTHLIPANVTLNLHHYENAIVPDAPVAQIKGQGMIDANYRETVKMMMEYTLERQGGDVGNNLVTEYLDTTRLQNRIPLSVPNLSLPLETAAVGEVKEAEFKDISPRSWPSAGGFFGKSDVVDTSDIAKSIALLQSMNLERE